MAATLYGYIVLCCDEYLRVRSFDGYMIEKDILQVSESMTIIPSPATDPNRTFYPGLKINYPLAATATAAPLSSPLPSSSSSPSQVEGKEEECEFDRKHYDRLVRFIHIARRLPLELQMVLCNHVYSVKKDIISTVLAEHSFRHAIQLYHPD